MQLSEDSGLYVGSFLVGKYVDKPENGSKD